MRNNKPIVIHLINGLETGGAEKALFNLINGGLEKKYTNHVISLSNLGKIGPDIQALGVPVTTLNMKGVWSVLPALLKLHHTIKEINPDIIQGWMYHGNLAALFARKMTKCKSALIWNIHHTLYDIKLEKLMTRQVIRLNRLFSSSPDMLLYVSQQSRKLHENYGYKPETGFVLPNGTDVDKFSFSQATGKKIRAQLDVPDDARVVGHAARLHPMKNHPMLIQAAVIIASKSPDVHFLFAGKGVASDNDKLTTMIPSSIESRIHLLGERNDISELMCAMDVYCLSSSWGEAFPIVLGEAMSTMIPCVATDVGDSELIIGDTGVIVPPDNLEAFVEGIEDILSMPREERNLMGKNARTRIEKNFSLVAIVEQLNSIYADLLTEKQI